MDGFETLTPAAPEILLAVLGMALLLVGVFRPQGGMTRLTWLVVLGFGVAAALILGQSQTATAFGGLFITDGFGRFMKILVLGAAAVTLILGLDYLRRDDMDRFEYPVLCLFATLGMLLMISANDLISLYVGLELQSLSLYVMAAFRRDNLRSTEAGLKYFVLGALSSGMLLYGASLIYGFTGTTSFPGLAAGFAAAEGGANIGVIVGLAFLCTGLAFKVSAVPFHMWTPDVYEGAPTPVTAFFAAAPKIAALALFARVLMGPFGDLVAQWQQIVFVIALLSMVVGSVAAIAQTNIKRLMAYSSIGHVGFALVGLAAGTEAGLRGLAIYLAIYVVMNLGTFACILSMRVNGQSVEKISDLAGLSRAHPTMALVMAAMMFSMAGIPPLAGFFGKLYVFMAAVQSGLYLLAILGVLASVVGAFYYLRIVKVMYFDAPGEALDPVSFSTSLVLTVTGLAVTFFVLFSAPLVDIAVTAAHAFAGG